jgi:hypothetical protein
MNIKPFIQWYFATSELNNLVYQGPFEKPIAAHCVKNSPLFKESEGSLPCSKESAMRPYYDPHKIQCTLSNPMTARSILRCVSRQR